jgi:WD40 repeat protein
VAIRISGKVVQLGAIANPICSFAWSKNKIATGYADGMIAIWDTYELLSKTSTPVTMPLSVFPAHVGPVTCLDFDPNSEMAILSAGRDVYVKLWNLKDVFIETILAASKFRINFAKWLSNGVYYSAEVENCCRYISDLGSPTTIIAGSHNSSVFDVAISHKSSVDDGEDSDPIVATVGPSGQLVLGFSVTHRRKKSFIIHSQWSHSDGKLTHTYDRSNYSSVSVTNTNNKLYPIESSLQCLAWNKNGYLAYGSSNGFLVLSRIP